MKTTIDIPEPLYKRVKIRAVEHGQTTKEIGGIDLYGVFAPLSCVR